MECQQYNSNIFSFDRNMIERLILKLADEYNICIEWDANAAILTGTFAVLGAVIGGTTGGKVAAAVGAGIGGVVGFGASTVVKLRVVWQYVKEKLEGLKYIVVNYLRRIDPEDIAHAIMILKRCMHSRKELVKTIVAFMLEKLATVVISSITAA